MYTEKLSWEQGLFRVIWWVWLRDVDDLGFFEMEGGKDRKITVEKKKRTMPSLLNRPTLQQATFLSFKNVFSITELQN